MGSLLWAHAGQADRRTIYTFTHCQLAELSPRDRIGGRKGDPMDMLSLAFAALQCVYMTIVHTILPEIVRKMVEYRELFVSACNSRGVTDRIQECC